MQIHIEVQLHKARHARINACTNGVGCFTNDMSNKSQNGKDNKCKTLTIDVSDGQKVNNKDDVPSPVCSY